MRPQAGAALARWLQLKSPITEQCKCLLMRRVCSFARISAASTQVRCASSGAARRRTRQHCAAEPRGRDMRHSPCEQFQDNAPDTNRLRFRTRRTISGRSQSGLAFPNQRIGEAVTAVGQVEGFRFATSTKPAAPIVVLITKRPNVSACFARLQLQHEVQEDDGVRQGYGGSSAGPSDRAGHDVLVGERQRSDNALSTSERPGTMRS